jgi:HSP20 family protein
MFGLMPRKRERAETPAPRVGNPIQLFRDEFDDLFDRFLEGWPLVDEGNRLAPTWGLDLEETDKEVTIRAEMPGFDAADFDIRVAGDLLTIQAEHKTEKGKEGEKKAERYAKMSRSVTLPPGTDTEKVEATYRNGILEMKMPRKPEAVGRKIPVKT